MTAPLLTFRRIDPATDGELAYANYHEAGVISFGDSSHSSSTTAYLKGLAARVEEFPDGHVLAMLGDRVVGQLELQVPYGLNTGYVNLFYVARNWRRLGFGRRLHEEYLLRYFRSWEADTVELHVSPTNHAAVQFYRSVGYKLATVEPGGGRMWRMELRLPKLAATSR
jgi:ribosomal protein S18 acetylase RimI-like enzyme